MFWKNGVHFYNTVAAVLMAQNTSLTHIMLVFPLICHLSVCLRYDSAVLSPAPHLLQLVYPAPQGVHLYALLTDSALQLSDGLLLLCAVALSLVA